MAIPHTRKRLAIPSIFRDSNGADNASPSSSSSLPSNIPGPSILLSSDQNHISLTPSKKKVKYSPSTRGFRGICGGFVSKSPSSLKFDQNASLSLGRASGDVTLVGSTNPRCGERVFVERANPKTFSTYEAMPPTDKKEERVPTIVPFIHQKEASIIKDATKAPGSPSTYNQGLSDLISQIMKNRLCVDCRDFRTTWSASELRLYEKRWKKLIKSSKSIYCWPNTRFSDIPWPVLSSAVISFPSPDLIDHMNVTRFFISPFLGQQKSSLDMIMDEIDRWNNFELMCCVLRKVRKSDRKNVEIAWSKVVLALMEVRGELMARRRIR